MTEETIFDYPIHFIYGSCTSCRESFCESKRPNMPPCGHLVCDQCYSKRCSQKRSTYSCPGCHVFYGIAETDAATRVLTAYFGELTEFCGEVKKLQVEKEKYEEEVISLREAVEKNEKMSKLKQVTDVKCSECERSDNEKSIQFCNSCLTQNFGIIENYVEYVRSSDRQFDSIAICAVCAIRNHMKKGHEVTEFFPTLLKFQFEEHCEGLKPKRENNQQENEKLKQGMGEIMVVIGEGEKELTRMTGMMGKCKSSALQKSIASRIAQQIGSNLEHVEKLREFVAEWCDVVKEDNNNLKEENDLNATECDEE